MREVMIAVDSSLRRGVPAAPAVSRYPITFVERGEKGVRVDELIIASSPRQLCFCRRLRVPRLEQLADGDPEAACKAGQRGEPNIAAALFKLGDNCARDASSPGERGLRDTVLRPKNKKVDPQCFVRDRGRIGKRHCSAILAAAVAFVQNTGHLVQH